MSESTAIRVLIAAATPALRAGLRALLASATISVIGEASALGGPGDADADVVVVADPELLGGLEGVEEGRLAAVVLAADERPLEALRALPLAGWGIVAPDASAGELQAAVAAAYHGLVVMPPALLERLPAARTATLADAASAEPLTAREHEVLALLSQGLPNKLIARQLQISEHTVKFHISSLFGKLGAASRTDAVSRGARLGLITL